MKRFRYFASAVLVTAFFIPSSADSLETQGRTITLSDAEWQACAEEGGCLVVSRADLAIALKAYAARELIACRNKL